MGVLASKVQNLQADLRQMLDRPLPTATEMSHIQDRVADLLLRALGDETHPLATGLEDLDQRCERERAGELYRDRENQQKPPPRKPNPLRHYFLVHPGAFDPEARRLWKLQLLLLTAAHSSAHRARLGQRLAMSSSTMRGAVAEAAHACGAAMWSPRQCMERLEEAVAVLAHADPAMPFRLAGRDFIHTDGTRARLSPQEAKFLQLLIDRPGQEVRYSTFAEQGVRHPTQVKNRLEKRLKEHGIELLIAARLMAYVLAVTPT